MKTEIASKERLVQHALEAMKKAFMTSPQGTRYGAAVLTSRGEVYTAGQYSSFNHITNIHAEVGAILTATMAGDPEVVALAIVSSASSADYCRPCGICRQVIVEHAMRTGKEILILMGKIDGSYEEMPIQALLPHVWNPAHRSTETISDRNPEFIMASSGRVYQFGTTIKVGDNEGLVWDASFMPGRLLVKWKYHEDKLGRTKLSHSTDEYSIYEIHAQELGLLSELPTGGVGSLIDPAAIHLVAPPLPIHYEDIPELGSILDEVGIAEYQVSTFCSRATGSARPDSDWDLVIKASPEEISRLRSTLIDVRQQGRLIFTPGSRTLRTLDSWYEGGHTRLFAEGRYNETFSILGTPFSIAYQPMDVNTTFGLDPHPKGFHILQGRVADTSMGYYKPAKYWIDTTDGSRVLLISYSKIATTLKEGAHILARGWLVEDNGQAKLLQINPMRETLDIL